ncbi:protein SCO1 homolog 2, mitochondrial-like [Phoenix dactylifera]|uniref:Protein SCO1 homolog 2, mitochondrial-like n=1 Tax=Phoenix dactylifera TaxID=42345 RepID=A0A8B8ZQL2_PHODC|nr:protein SCO1 homolog 2, mitochondrial-like [Phoenix dactylifera]
MLRSRLVGVSLRNGSRVFTRSPPSTRVYPFQGFQSRGYIEGTNYRDHKLPRKLPEDNELHSQSWRNYIIPTAVLVIAGAGLLIHYNDEKRAIPKGAFLRICSMVDALKLFCLVGYLLHCQILHIGDVRTFLFRSHQSTNSDGSKVNRPAIGGPFRLFDTEKNLVTESNLQGNWTLMYFGYTSSPDVGPEEVKKMAEVIQILESEHNFKITPIFVTIDPQRDSPAQLRAYLGEFDSRIIGLTGPIAAVRQMAQEYRIYFKKVDEEGQDYLVECSHNMYLLDPNMEILRCFGVEYDALQLSNAIMMEMKKASK